MQSSLELLQKKKLNALFSEDREDETSIFFEFHSGVVALWVQSHSEIKDAQRALKTVLARVIQNPSLIRAVYKSSGQN